MIAAIRDRKKSCEVDGGKKKSFQHPAAFRPFQLPNPLATLCNAGPFLTVHGQLMNEILECRSHM